MGKPLHSLTDNLDWLAAEVAKGAQARRETGWQPEVPVETELPKRWGPDDVVFEITEERTRSHDEDHWRPVRGLVRARRHPRWRICPVCHGSRSIWTEREVGGLVYTAAADCRCVELDRRIALYNQAALPAQEHGKAWATTSWSTEPYVTARVQGCDPQGLQAPMREWLRTWHRGAHGWVVFGATGTGKTHLGHAIMQYLVLTHGVSAVWWSSRELFREMDAAQRGQVPLHHVLQPIISADVLVFDELRPTKAWWWDKIIEALESRTDARPANTTIVTTNLVPGIGQSLYSAIGSRLHSRLTAATRLISLTGQDQRAVGHHHQISGEAA